MLFLNTRSLIDKTAIRYTKIPMVMVMKSVFTLAYFSKRTKQYGLYSHLLLLYSRHRAAYQSNIRVAYYLPRIVLCQVLYRFTCIV